MNRRILMSICFCLVIYVTACESNTTINSIGVEMSAIKSDETPGESSIEPVNDAATNYSPVEIDVPKDNPLNDEYQPVEITATISADKPEYRFIKRSLGFVEKNSEEKYLEAVIEVYEAGTTTKLISSVETSVYLASTLENQMIWESCNIIDVNFDGYNDIVVIERISGNQGMHSYGCFTWNEELSRFEAASFPDWGFVSIDTERKMLLAAWRETAAAHGWAIYEYIDGTLTKTNECGREYLSSLDDEAAVIHLYATQLIGDEIKTVFDGNVNEDELDMYLLYDNLWRLGSKNWINVWSIN